MIEQTPRGDRVATLAMTPFPANAVSLFVQEPLISESTSEAERSTLVESPRLTIVVIDLPGPG